MTDEWDDPLPPFIMIKPERVKSYEAKYLGIGRCRELQVVSRDSSRPAAVLQCVWHGGTVAKIYERDSIPSMPYQPVKPDPLAVRDIPMSDDNDWSDYESGPFCIHWSYVGDCDKVCQCGHPCGYHDGNCRECQCQEFKDKVQDGALRDIDG